MAGALCACGSGWFDVEALCLEDDGTVSGYLGPIECIDCGATWVPRQERLRVVR